tara:strand:- start:131 stop:493 length:363 start_codon:yes stop_codon:yes gene_type:complete
MNTESYIKNTAIRDVLNSYGIIALKWGETWESIILAEDQEKPTKEAFEAKLKDLIDAQPLKELREERNRRITQTDYLATIDYPHATPEKKQQWFDYRQALRDLPSTTEDPANVVWPTPPE